MIRFLTPLLFIFFTGCAVVQPEEPTLIDVSYSLKGDGNLSLNKNYLYGEKQVKVKTQKLASSLQKVPNFTDQQNLAVEFEKEKKSAPRIALDNQSVSLSVEAIPLHEFIKVAFGQILGKNYLLSKEIEAIEIPVTLNMTQKVPKKEFLAIIKSILTSNGVMTSYQNSVFTFESKNAQTQTQDSRMFYVGRYIPSSVNANEDISVVVPLYYTNSKILKEMMFMLKLKNIYLYSYTDKNLILKGEAGKLRKLLSIVELLDRPYLAQKKFYTLKLNFIDVEVFTKRVSAIFTKLGIPLSSSAKDTGLVLEPIPEDNSLLIISEKQAWIDNLLFWREKLDIEQDSIEEPKLYIYEVSNRVAEELAQVVAKFMGMHSQSSIKDKTKADITQKEEKKKTNFTTQQASIDFDASTNKLIIKATPSEYKNILPILKELDVMPLQILLEVTFAEVTLTDQLQLGLEWYLKNSKNNWTLGTRDGLSLGAGGITGTIFKSISSSDLEMIINAFAQKKLLNIVSKPHIVVLNNDTGSFNSGNQIPVISSEVSAGDLTNNTTTPSLLRNINYQNTGTNLSITPTVNSQSILTLQIQMQISEAQINSTSNIDSPLIVNRQISTSVVMKSGDTILIGGMMNTNDSNSHQGIPILKDIPFIGSLFKTKSTSTTKTELVMLVKPTIIKTPSQMSYESRRIDRLLKHIKYSIEK